MIQYKDFSSWIKEIFPYKVQKISIDAGFTCPNRDGRVGTGGCTFCDNTTFSPAYCNGARSVSEQMTEGKAFFARKYPKMKYLAYFQSYSNTYAPLEKLKALYEEALKDEDVVGLVIGTRPDCISEALLDYLQELAKEKFVLMEYGVESVSDKTLERVNRGHDFKCALEAIKKTAKRGIFVGAHIILGLPGDNEEETIAGIRKMHEAGMTLLKLHQLQVIRDTRMAEKYEKEHFPLFSAQEYINTICKYIKTLPDTIIYDRFVSQSPAEKVIAPRWGLKNHEFTDLLKNSLKNLDN